MKGLNIIQEKMDYTIIIEYLKSIQDNLIGIIIPVIISAIMSIVTLIVNSVIQLNIIDRQYKSKQYEIMRENYPKLKSYLINIECCYINIQNNKLYESDFALINYIAFDWVKYRSRLNKEVQYVDEFEKEINNLIDNFKKLYNFFEKTNIPASSKKVNKAINDIQFYCSLISNYPADQKLEKIPVDYNYKKIKKVILTLDNHYNKF